MRYLPAVLVTLLPFAAVGVAAEPSKERGDQMEAAVVAHDPQTLKALLKPEDRQENAVYHLSSDRPGLDSPIGNLLLQAQSQSPECFQALIDYGIWVDPLLLDRGLTDLSYIKSHYPDFPETLGARCIRYAAGAGNEEMIARFLEAGAKPKADALTEAVMRNRPGAVKLLVKAGAPRDGKLPIADGAEPVSVIDYARRTMRFSVVDVLDPGGKDSPEVAAARKARTPDANVPLGRWSFSSIGLSFDLQEDGSGVMYLKSVSDDVGEPVLWTVKTTPTAFRFLAVTPVPGYREKPVFKEADLTLGSSGLSIDTHSGSQAGVLAGMDDGQRRIMTARQAAVKYTGPTGRWLAQAPANATARDFEMAAKVTLEIEAAGKAVLYLVSPQGVRSPVPGQIQPQGADFSLVLDSGGSPMTLVLTGEKSLELKHGGDAIRFVKLEPDATK